MGWACSGRERKALRMSFLGAFLFLLVVNYEGAVRETKSRSCEELKL